MSQWSQARVNIDYHVAFDDNFYSVPYRLSEEPVEVRATPTTVEIFHKGTRVASHPRGRKRNQAITQNEHRPKSLQAIWSGRRHAWCTGRDRSGRTLRDCSSAFCRRSRIREMGYRSCLGILRLAERYSAIRMEGAAQRALESHACRFKSVESILKNSLDQQPFTQLPSLPPSPPHDNIRGGEYFDRPGSERAGNKLAVTVRFVLSNRNDLAWALSEAEATFCVGTVSTCS